MAVTKFEITSREVAWNGDSFGEIGQYEFIQGTMHYSVNPKDDDSKLITDIGLIPLEQDGMIHFSSDVQILKPVTPSPNGSLLFDVVNRGNRTAMAFNNVGQVPPSNLPPEKGNGFLMRRGFTVVFCGWQTDVPDGRIRLHVPEAMGIDGKRLVGPAYQQFDVMQDTHELLLSDRQHKPLPTANFSTENSTLLEREWPDGPYKLVPSDQWTFGRWIDNKSVPDQNYICLTSGFKAGKVYEIIYETVGAPVIGLGFLAMRDCPSFLKYGTPQNGNPCAGTLDRAYAYGASQSGRFIREYIYLGVNLDEENRVAFDGLMPHTGSSRLGEFNMRFGQPSSNHLRNVGNIHALTYTEVTDPVTEEGNSLLGRLEKKGNSPKIMATNSAVEYWWSGAALSHMDPTGHHDVPPPSNVRIYHLTGTKHGPGTLPLTDLPLEDTRQQHWSNTVDYRPILRALLHSLDQWVRSDINPPESQIPKISDGSAVSRESLESIFSSIPGMGFPTALPIRRRLEYGQKMSEGVAVYPAIEGVPFNTMVSAVDQDGNEIAGIRHPDIQVPLGTHTGWTMRHNQIGGEGHFIPLQGAVVPFPLTQESARSSRDPRRAIDERYASKTSYLALIDEVAQKLVSDGYLLKEDISQVIEDASQRWDAFHHKSRG